MPGHQQSTSGSFGDPSTQRLTLSLYRIVSGELKVRFLLSSEHIRTTPDLLWFHMPSRSWCMPGLPDEGFTRWMRPQLRSQSHSLRFHHRLIPWVTAVRYRTRAGERGTSPVKFTSHFPEANASTTMTFDAGLTVSVRRRRSFKVWTAMLHQFAGAGTSPRPIAASSPGLVPWLLRYHCLR